MITPNMIPKEVVAVAKRAWANGTGPTSDDDMEAAITAALNAWPGMGIEVAGDESEAIFLPLPPEKETSE